MALDAEAPFAFGVRRAVDSEEVALGVADLFTALGLFELVQETFERHDLGGFAVAGFAEGGLEQRVSRFPLLFVHVADFDGFASAVRLGDKVPVGPSLVIIANRSRPPSAKPATAK